MIWGKGSRNLTLFRGEANLQLAWYPDLNWRSINAAVFKKHFFLIQFKFLLYFHEFDGPSLGINLVLVGLSFAPHSLPVVGTPVTE